MANEKNKPIHEIRIGRMKASVWKTDGKYGPKLSVKAPVISYQLPEDKRENKKDDGWRESVFFDREDTLIAQQVLQRAFEFIADYKEESE